MNGLLASQTSFESSEASARKTSKFGVANSASKEREMERIDFFPSPLEPDSLAGNIRKMQNENDPDRDVANRNTFNPVGSEPPNALGIAKMDDTPSGHYNSSGQFILGTHGGFFTSKGGEWCEGTVQGGYFTPTGEWVSGVLNDETEIGGTTWGKIRTLVKNPNYKKETWFA